LVCGRGEWNVLEDQGRGEEKGRALGGGRTGKCETTTSTQKVRLNTYSGRGGGFRRQSLGGGKKRKKTWGGRDIELVSWGVDSGLRTGRRMGGCGYKKQE